jgi:hypothetical protein
MNRTLSIVRCVIALEFLFIVPPAVFAKDYFLTIGGGFDPDNNQVSLEKNVAFLQSVLAEERPDRPPHEIYFADGDDDARDVHFRDPEFAKTCPPARRMMAEIFGDPNSMDFVYRNHQVAPVAGPIEKELLDARFHSLATELRAGDRLTIYVTGHGGPATTGRGGRRRGRGRNPYDTTIYLWNDERLSASEFSTWLDRLPRDVTVILVMVQCHAGGFAHAIFNQGASANGLAPHARCGFFSQVHDRAAAGCTPDVDEADYQEYSSFFWAALAGRTRAGEPLTGIDFDGNGAVSFAEAHAYAVLASDTIDIPLRTSDVLLREFSQTQIAVQQAARSTGAAAGRRGFRGRSGLGRRGSRAIERLQSAETPESPVETEIMALAGPIARLAEMARPEQRAILTQLPSKLGLRGDITVEEVQRRLAVAEREIDLSDERLNEALDREDDALATVQDELRLIWPELNSDYSPTAMALASERADEFVQDVNRLASYRELLRAREEKVRAADARLDAERTEAKMQRLLRTCEEVILAANLSKVAPAEIVARYEQLVQLEDSTLNETK